MHKVIVVQARLASSRFPRRVLAELGGKSILAHCVERLKAASQADEICVAIPASESENELAAIVNELGVTLVRGSEADVLGRFIQAAYQTKADIVVRVKGDDPFVSAGNIDRQIEALQADSEIDYVCTENLPAGVSSETMTLKTLEKLDYLARHQDLRGHVTSYLRNNPGPFVIKKLEAPEELNRPNYRLSLDTDRDYQLFKAIFDELYKGEPIAVKDVITLLDNDESLRRLATIELGIGVAN
jgi:spore coat polysaccharide biosynthesis protein SpsF